MGIVAVADLAVNTASGTSSGKNDGDPMMLVSAAIDLTPRLRTILGLSRHGLCAREAELVRQAGTFVDRLVLESNPADLRRDLGDAGVQAGFLEALAPRSRTACLEGKRSPRSDHSKALEQMDPSVI
jgi:hypothetical protein